MDLFAPVPAGRMATGWTGRRLYSSLRAQSAAPGGVAERLNAPVLKTGVPSQGPWVRIPPPPPDSAESVSYPRFNKPIQAARVTDARGFSVLGDRQ